jgi:hypothetical protein
MRALLAFTFLLVSFSAINAQTPPLDANALVQEIQGGLTAPYPPPEAKVDPSVRHGEILDGSINDSPIYPGAPFGPVVSFCFGGAHFDVLYVTDGTHVFQRKLKVPGYEQWMAPVAYPSQGEG